MKYGDKFKKYLYLFHKYLFDAYTSVADNVFCWIDKTNFLIDESLLQRHKIFKYKIYTYLYRLSKNKLITKIDFKPYIDSYLYIESEWSLLRIPI